MRLTTWTGRRVRQNVLLIHWISRPLRQLRAAAVSAALSFVRRRRVHDLPPPATLDVDELTAAVRLLIGAVNRLATAIEATQPATVDEPVEHDVQPVERTSTPNPAAASATPNLDRIKLELIADRYSRPVRHDSGRLDR